MSYDLGTVEYFLPILLTLWKIESEVKHSSKVSIKNIGELLVQVHFSLFMVFQLYLKLSSVRVSSFY